MIQDNIQPTMQPATHTGIIIGGSGSGKSNALATQLKRMGFQKLEDLAAYFAGDIVCETCGCPESKACGESCCYDIIKP